MVEDVCFHELPVLATFQCQHISSRCIHQDHPHVLPIIQVTVQGGESLVIAIQLLTKFTVRLLVILLVGIQLFIDITHGDILSDAVGLLL